ncbi:MAG: hypothetical protein AAGD11_18510 [Planctomycetota bacterium]
MRLRWKASFSASCLHAAASMLEGLPIADTSAAANLRPCVEALRDELRGCGLDAGPTLQLLVGLAAEYENNRQLVEVAVTRSRGRAAIDDATIRRLAGCIADLEATWLRLQPNLVDELSVRGRPMREQWESRGPGLLRAAERLTDEEFLAPAAEIVLVTPIIGGHGRAHLRSNRVTLEAVLTNVDPDLPEILRVGWLLTQLNLDLPVRAESVSAKRLPQLASLATVPLTLAAAADVELAQLDNAAVTRALQVWHLPPGVATQLLHWWTSYVEDRPRWAVAIAALAQMLPD